MRATVSLFLVVGTEVGRPLANQGLQMFGGDHGAGSTPHPVRYPCTNGVPASRPVSSRPRLSHRATSPRWGAPANSTGHASWWLPLGDHSLTGPGPFPALTNPTLAQPRPAGPHGLHNRNSGCGRVSHRRPGPPCSPSFLHPPHPHCLSPPRPGLGTHTPSEAAALAAPARVSPITRQRRVRGPEVGRARMPGPYLAHSSFRRTAAGTRTHTCSTCSRTCPRSDTTSDHRSSSERHSLRTQGTRYGLRAGDVKGSCLGGTGHCPRRQPRGAKAAR